jgi:plastocyanin
VSKVTSPKTVSDSGLVAAAAVVQGFDVPATGARTTWTVSFAGAKKGTYSYVCQIHDGMEGSIVVK